MDNEIYEGFIEFVEDDKEVYCRFIDHKDENRQYCFHLNIFSQIIPECQRQYIQDGAYFLLINGYMLIHKTILTTYDIEQADIRAKELYKKLNWDKQDEKH